MAEVEKDTISTISFVLLLGGILLSLIVTFWCGIYSCLKYHYHYRHRVEGNCFARGILKSLEQRWIGLITIMEGDQVKVSSSTRTKKLKKEASKPVVVVLQDVINVSGRFFLYCTGWISRLVRYIRPTTAITITNTEPVLGRLGSRDRNGPGGGKFVFGDSYDSRWIAAKRIYWNRRRKNNEMGALLDKPKIDKYNEHGEWNGLRYGLASMQGWRIEMEDAHCAVMGLPGQLKEWAFFAVFDGHAGERVSSHCADNLLETIIQTEQFARCASEEEVSIEEIKKGIRDGFLLLDDKMRTIPEMASGEDKSGSTAVCVLISPTHMYIANCGDSRSVMCRDGRVNFATQDHKPINPAEKERIQNAGGSVMIQRVNGSLAVSRALGDYEYKNVEGKGQCEQLVSPEPEISVEPRDPSHDEFMVLACDGVWDVMSNEDLVEFIRSRLRITNDLESICNQVIDTCLYKGSRDNMSMVLVTFPACPPPVEEAGQKEAALEELLKNRVTELVHEADGNIELPHILQTLSDEDISDLPPGGGLQAKRTFIESVYKSLCPNSDTLDT